MSTVHAVPSSSTAIRNRDGARRLLSAHEGDLKHPSPTLTPLVSDGNNAGGLVKNAEVRSRGGAEVRCSAQAKAERYQVRSVIVDFFLFFN